MMSGNNSSDENLILDKKFFAISGCGFIMLSENIYSLMLQYITNGRSRVPPEYVLGELLPTFQDGARTDRRALQSKFKSWSKRMEIQEENLVLVNSGKLILPKEKCSTVIMDLHLQDHCCIDDLVMRIQQKYTWSRKNFGMDWDIVIDCLTSNCHRINCLRKLEERLRKANFFSRPAIKLPSYEYSENTGRSIPSCNSLAFKENTYSMEALASNFSEKIEIIHASKGMISTYSNCKDRTNLNQRTNEHPMQNIENKTSLRPQLYSKGFPSSPILKEHVVIRSKKPTCTSARELLKIIERKTQDEDTLKCVRDAKTQFLADLNLVPLKYCPRKKILTLKQRLSIKQQMLKRRSLLQRSGMGRYNLRHIKVKKSRPKLNYNFQERLQPGYYKRWNSLKRRKSQPRSSAYGLRPRSASKTFLESNLDVAHVKKRLRMKRSLIRKKPEVIDIISSTSDDEQTVPDPPIVTIKREESSIGDDQRPWCFDQYMFNPTFYPQLRSNVPPPSSNTFTKFSTNTPRMASYVNPSGRPFLHKFDPLSSTYMSYPRPGVNSSNPRQPSPSILRFWKPNVENINQNKEQTTLFHPWGVKIPNTQNSYQVVRLPTDAKFLVVPPPNRLPGTLIRIPGCGTTVQSPRLQAQPRFLFAGSRFRNLAPKPAFTSTSSTNAVATTIVVASSPPVSCHVVCGKDEKNRLAKNKVESQLKIMLEKPGEKPSEKPIYPIINIKSKNKISASWNEKASNLSRLITRLKCNYNLTIFQEGKEKSIERVSNQLDVGIALVKESRKSLVELEKSLDVKKEDSGQIQA